MADHHSHQGSSSRNVSDGSLESTVELNVKTLDSRIYSFHVDKNIAVSSFKEKIASQIGVPVGQQRLIFRGKVLKDDRLLSEYNVDNGHTLHLVERQPSQSQPSSGTSSGERNTNNGNRGQEPTAGGPRPRIGQISHSVVLGSLNVGDQGEGGIVPDLSRVIGAVLNSIGIGNLTGGAQPGIQFNAHVPTPQVNETEGTRSSAVSQNVEGSQVPPGQTFTGPSLQIPVGPPVQIPSFNAPIPDSLGTISEFMSRMEQALSQDAGRTNQSPHSGGDIPTVELPSNYRGVATPEGLRIVLRQAERLIGGCAVAALSHIAGRLEQEGDSTDPGVRGRIQTESVQVGVAMQHLGSLFLELGRTILTLRMGHTPAESAVNAGPAVYISPTGPNPIMVQPFPLQTSSLFGSFAPTSAPAPNTGVFGPVGIGNIARNVNIHIHTGASLAPIVSAVGPRATNAGGSPGDGSNSTGSGNSNQPRVLPVRNVIPTAIPSQPSVVTVPGGVQLGAAVSHPPVSASLSNVISDVSSQVRNIIDTMRNEQQTSRGNSSIQEQSVGSHCEGISSSNTCHDKRAEEDKIQPQASQPCTTESTGSLTNSKEEPSTSSSGSSQPLSGASKACEVAPKFSQMDKPEGSSATPIGLGLGGLQPKRRSRQSTSQVKSNDGSTSSNQNQSRMVGQQVLQTLASFANRQNADIPSSGSLPHSTSGGMETTSAGGQNADTQIDVADAMSQMLQSPALDGLLTGVSQQTGVGSPDVLRNMMSSLTQNPVMRNTVNQLAQQIDNRDIGSMFSGLAGGQGGGFDLSRMIQQMMPVVSQALAGASAVPQSSSVMDSELRPSRPGGDLVQVQETVQVNLQQVARRIEHQSPPGEIFSAMVENVARLGNNGSDWENLVNELGGEEGLVNEFMEMLHQDVSRRLHDAAE